MMNRHQRAILLYEVKFKTARSSSMGYVNNKTMVQLCVESQTIKIFRNKRI